MVIANDNMKEIIEVGVNIKLLLVWFKLTNSLILSTTFLMILVN